MESIKKGEIQKLIIKGRLPGLNEIIDANRRHRNAGATQKRNTDKRIVNAIKSQKIQKQPGLNEYEFNWFCKDRRRDKDNIAVGKKFVFDALQTAGIIENDGWQQVERFTDKFHIDKENERLEVIIKKVEEDI